LINNLETIPKDDKLVNRYKNISNDDSSVISPSSVISKLNDDDRKTHFNDSINTIEEALSKLQDTLSNVSNSKGKETSEANSVVSKLENYIKETNDRVGRIESPPIDNVDEGNSCSSKTPVVVSMAPPVDTEMDKCESEIPDEDENESDEDTFTMFKSASKKAVVTISRKERLLADTFACQNQHITKESIQDVTLEPKKFRLYFRLFQYPT